jgi:hypothetical protein
LAIRRAAIWRLGLYREAKMGGLNISTEIA